MQLKALRNSLLFEAITYLCQLNKYNFLLNFLTLCMYTEEPCEPSGHYERYDNYDYNQNWPEISL